MSDPVTDSKPLFETIRRTLTLRRSQFILVAILAALHLFLGLSRPFTIEADGLEYVIMAEMMRLHGQFSYDGVQPVVGKPPGMAVLILCWESLAGSLTGMHVVQLLLLFVAYLMVAAIAWELGGVVVSGLVLTALVLLHPLNALAAQPLSEPSFLALQAAGLFLTIRSFGNGKWSTALLAGLCFGLATYMRPVTLFFPFAILAVTIVFARRYWRLVLVLAATHAVIVAPWIIRTSIHFGRPVPMVANYGPLFYMTEEGLWRTYFFDGTGVIRSSPQYKEITKGEFQFNRGPAEEFYREALENIKEDPGEYLWRCVRQSAFAWSYLPGTKELHNNAPVLFGLGRASMLIFYLLAILVGAVIWKSGMKRIVMMLYGHWVYTAAMLFPFCTESRYLIPVYVTLLPLAVLGFGRLIARRPGVQ